MSTAAPRMIAVDFDGTICGFAYPGIGEPKAGAKEALAAFRKLGYHVLVYSCRGCKWYPEIFANMEGGEAPGTPTQERRVFKEMKAWLDEHQIPYDSIDDGALGKPLADFYIDDKGIRFQDNWDDIAMAISLVTLGKGLSLVSPIAITK